MACTAFDLARITAYKARIEALDTAIIGLIEGQAKEYSINTGETVRKVTRYDLAELQSMSDSLYNQLVILETRCGQRTSARQIYPDY